MKKWQLILLLLNLENLTIASEQARAAAKAIKDFICSYEGCGQAFAKKVDFARHERIHTGERPYVCDICGNSFARKSTLGAHKRTHTGEKPYVCNTCGKGFANSSSLTIHKRTHSGEKPYVCNICDTRFTQINSLNKHKQCIHAQKASADKKRPRDTDTVEFEDPGLLDDLLVPGGAGGVDGLVSADLELDDALAQSLFDDSLEDV